MKITLKVQYLDDADKSDSIVVVADMLAAFGNNHKADGLTLSISRWMPPYRFRSEEDAETYHNSKVKSRY